MHIPRSLVHSGGFVLSDDGLDADLGSLTSPKTGLGQRRQLIPQAGHPHSPFTTPYREVLCRQTGYPPINAFLNIRTGTSFTGLRVIVVCLLVAALPAAS